jgi:maltooligosyltrehalose trehalohydrolase
MEGSRHRQHAMDRDGEAFRVVVKDARPGEYYSYVLDEKANRPDPVSRSQPEGVHGPSQIVDPNAFAWSDSAWRGIPLRDYIIYELHVGTFTPEGTFEAAIASLPYLKELGITSVELMPVAEFPGSRNWGYDGVDIYAPQSTYGGPTGLKKLVDACHASGLAVVLDVVYNHFGPEGNYLGEFGPYFTDHYKSPWGDAINFDSPGADGVRRLVIDNALYWLTEYHIDALRLDAIHAIYDFSARHVLEEMAGCFREQAERLGRQAFTIAESDLNDVRVIAPREAGGHALDAQWLDDFHHAIFTVLSGNRHGFLRDFGHITDICKALRDGYVIDGIWSAYRQRRFGNSSKDRPGEQFVAFLENHDQVANTSEGLRLAARVSFEEQKLAAAVLLCAPYVPLLFMGQEFSDPAPFLYFTSHTDPELARAVSEGRKKEYGDFGSTGDGVYEDPQSQQAFDKSKLSWNAIEAAPHSAMLRLYRDLIGLRKREPALSNCRRDLTRVEADENARTLTMERSDPSGSSALLLCNFGEAEMPQPDPSWKLAIATGSAQYGGHLSPGAPGTAAIYLRE